MNQVRNYNEVMKIITETNDIKVARSNYKYIIENKYRFPLVQLEYAEEIYYCKAKELISNFSIN